MIKRYFCLFATAVFATLSLTACNQPEPEEPGELEPLVSSVPVTQNWIFEGKPSLVIHVENPNSVKVTAAAKVILSTDKGESIGTVEGTTEVPANGTADITIKTANNLEPGFYKAKCYIDNKVVRNFVFGVDPLKIVSAPDKQADFDKFWEDGKAQLAAIDMKAELTEIPAKSTDKRKVYLVEMQSVPDGLEGDPVIIRGYYCEPQDGKPHDVIMHFFGYDDQKPTSKAFCPGGNDNPDYAEFHLSNRGQQINNRTADKRVADGKGDFVNIYGDWFAFNFGQRDAYYYRGAFLDCVQAVRFMATRSTSNMTNLYAEGSSQGGAFSYAAAALSDYPFTAIAPCVAFLGDFPDYFNIVSWPGDTARKNKGSMTDAEMYAFLSYFDTKNLATRIKCAVLACSGLQDGTCPPHTNTAPFTNLPNTDKEMYYYPEMKHEIPGGWTTKYMDFFKKRRK